MALFDIIKIKFATIFMVDELLNGDREIDINFSFIFMFAAYTKNELWVFLSIFLKSLFIRFNVLNKITVFIGCVDHMDLTSFILLKFEIEKKLIKVLLPNRKIIFFVAFTIRRMKLPYSLWHPCK